MNNPQAEVKSSEIKRVGRFLFLACCLIPFTFSLACRYDMQDQPRYKAYNHSDFFTDGKAMRDLPEGTVARGQLRADKAFYTGKKENADPNAAVQTATDPATGNLLVSSFPNDIEKIPIPVTQELLDRGEQRYKVFCIVCHGPVGNGDGMIVRRGFSKPSTYHDDRLRNAPDGHFFDVMTNGWGKMSSYASQIPPGDRWAIVSYIRALQISQNPNGITTMTTTENNSTKPANEATPPTAANPLNGQNPGGEK